MTKQTFGHFSESEVDSIANILEANEVEFEIAADDGISKDIQSSMRNNLRYLHGATICNDLLVLVVDPAELKSLPKQIQERLNELRLFWDEPEFDIGEEFEIPEKTQPTSPQRVINTQEGNRNKVLGLVFLLSLILSSLAWAVSLLKGP